MSRRLVIPVGFGAYPGDPCFDPDRPSWLPYWLDDFTESECKYNATSIGGAIVGAFESPGEVASNVGGVVGQAAGSLVSDVAGGAASAGSGFLSSLDLQGELLLAGGVLLGVVVLMEVLKK